MNLSQIMLARLQVMFSPYSAVERIETGNAMNLPEIQNALRSWGWLNPQGFPDLFERDDKSVILTANGGVVYTHHLHEHRLLGYAGEITMAKLAEDCR